VSSNKSVYSSQLNDRAILLQFAKCKIGKKIACKKCSWGRLKYWDERSFRCLKCWRRVSITTGSWIESSRLPLRFWYEIAWSFVLAHSARKTGRLLEHPYKSVWSSYQKIRRVIVQNSEEYKEQITGTIELDESFYGGTFKNLRKKIKAEFRRLGLNKRGGGAKYRKQPIFGIYKRNGKVFLELIPEAKAKILLPIIKNRIKLGSNVFSDTATPYTGLVGLGYVHRTVDHGKEEYVNGEVHINGMEGFWGLSKTNMHTYKGIKKKNWVFSIKEMEWRYNTRDLTFAEQVTEIMKLLMTYRKEIFVRS